MSTAAAGMTAHALNASVFLALAATGVLLQSPALRASITGGHSLTLIAVHRVAGGILPFAVGLLAAVAWSARRRRRGVGSHLFAVAVTTALLVSSGLALWGGRTMPVEVLDQAQGVHVWAGYAALAVLALHLVQVAGRRLRAPVGRVDHRGR